MYIIFGVHLSGVIRLNGIMLSVIVKFKSWGIMLGLKYHDCHC